MTGADLLVDMLVRYGVDTIFGVPGDTNVSFYDALRRRAGEIRHVMARDERSAGFMADAYARLTNRPAVFECPSGAGAMYSLPPLAEANASSVAVILLTIDLPLASEGRSVITELDAARLFEPVTKMSTQVKLAEKLPETVRRAFRAACAGRPGAVHLQIPEDLLLADVDTCSLALHVEPQCRVFPAFPGAARDEDLSALLALLKRCSRPVILAGGGINRSQAGEALAAVAMRVRIPVVSTITGQCALPDGHPLFMGVAGDNGFHSVANEALERADLVLILGSKVGSVVTVGGTFPTNSLHRRVVQVDIDPQQLANNYENLLSIAADVGTFLQQLQAAAGADFDSSRYQGWIAQLQGERECADAQATLEMSSDAQPLRAARIVGEINRRLARWPHPVNILCDAGTPTPYIARYLRLGHPDSRLIIPRAFGGLGYSLPGVVGAWHADGTRRPLALFGDGSFNMALGELETLVRMSVPAILILFNNGCYGWIKGLQRLRGDPSFGVDFEPPRGEQIAAAFGLRAWTARTPAEFALAMDSAFEHDGPCLIDAHVESLSDRLPPVFSWSVKARLVAASDGSGSALDEHSVQEYLK